MCIQLTAAATLLLLLLPVPRSPRIIPPIASTPQLATFDVRLGVFEVEVFVDFSLDEGSDRNESDEKEEESNLHFV